MGPRHIVLNQLQSADQQVVQLDSLLTLGLRKPEDGILLHFDPNHMRGWLLLRVDHGPIAAGVFRFNHLQAQK